MKFLLSTAALLGSAAYVAGQCVVPAATCANPTVGPYQPEPCFPNSGVCYPTNYYAATDPGQFDSANGDVATQLSNTCQITCDAQSQCLSYVGIFYNAADTTLASGTCFYYNVAQVFPRQCADSPSGIVANYKQQVCPAGAPTTTTTTTTTPSTTTAANTPTTTFTVTTPTTTTTSTSISISTPSTSPSTTISTSTSGTVTISVTLTSTSSSSTPSTTSLITISTTLTTSTTSSSSTTTSSSTISTTSTTTSTTAAAPLVTQFNVFAQGSPNVPDGTTLGDGFDGGPNQEGFALFDNTGIVFALDTNSYIIDTSTGNYANILPGPEATGIYFNAAADIEAQGFVYCTGSIDGNNDLNIDCDGLTVVQTYSQDTSNAVYISDQLQPDYNAVTLLTGAA